jgi:transcriptional regulator with XRE-family HTH domain
MLATRWDRYFDRQMEDPAMKDLIERELAVLRLGAAIAKMRAKRKLTQTQLAALAGMSASKISAIESSATNVEVATLIRIAGALGYQFKPKFVPTKSNKHARGRRAQKHSV